MVALLLSLILFVLFLILCAIAPMLVLGVLAVVGIVLVILGLVWLINNDTPTPAARTATKPVKPTRDPERYEWNEFDRIGAAKDWNRANVAAAKARKK